MIIPDSGKPADIDKAKIKTIADADRVIAWLSDVILDMDRQLEEANSPSSEWLKRVKSARWWSSHIRHQVLEMREELTKKATAREAVASVIVEFLDDDEDLAELGFLIEERFPHLTGLSLKATFG